MKKLTSERLGRESLAAWEDRKQNTDPEVSVMKEMDKEKEAIDALAEPEVVVSEPTEKDSEAQIQPGTSCAIIN